MTIEKLSQLKNKTPNNGIVLAARSASKGIFFKPDKVEHIHVVFGLFFLSFMAFLNFMV
jgi:hypothetical protein